MDLLKKNNSYHLRHPFLLIFLICISVGIVTGLYVDYAKVSDTYLVLIFNIFIFSLSLMMGAYLYVKRALNDRRVLILILICSFALRLSYIIYTGAEQRQHDVHSFGGPDGHAAYIEYIYNNGALPDFNPTLLWQFYHPPLHHIICAIWLKIQTLIGISYTNACEGLQFLTLFYSTACTLTCIKIFKRFNLHGIPLYIAAMFVCFNPTFIIMSGSINNDILSVLFILLTVYNTMRWYKSPGYKEIIAVAFSIGFGMLTKMSVALTAPCVALVFLIKLIKDSKNRVKFIKQFTVFGIICIPLGLCFSIRNLVLFDVPVTYVPMLSEDSMQYVGNIPLFQRLFDFSFYQFKSLYMAWGNERFGVSPYYEFNPTVGLLKTAVFGEYVFKLNSILFVLISTILLCTFVFCLTTAGVGTVCSFVSGEYRKNRFELCFLLLATAVYVISYYKFCIEYPHTCTMNIRYVVILLPFIGVLIGLLLQKLRKKKSTVCAFLRYLICTAVIIFCASSAIVYTVLPY